MKGAGLATAAVILLSGCTESNSAANGSNNSGSTISGPYTSCGERFEVYRGLRSVAGTSGSWAPGSKWKPSYIDASTDQYSLSAGGSYLASDGNCRQLGDVFGSFAYQTWQVDEAIINKGELFGYTPRLKMQFAEPNVTSLAHWRESGEPEFEDTHITDAELSVWLNYSGAMHLFHDESEVTKPVTLSCSSTAIQHQFRLAPVAQISRRNFDESYCETKLNNSTGDFETQCLLASPVLPQSGLACSFTSTEIMVPNNQNQYFPAMISGHISQPTPDEIKLTITEAGV